MKVDETKPLNAIKEECTLENMEKEEPKKDGKAIQFDCNKIAGNNLKTLVSPPVIPVNNAG